MKKNLLILAVTVPAVLFSCTKTPDSTSTVTATVKLEAAEEVTIPDDAVFTVTATNFDTKQEIDVQAEDMTAVFTGLVPGRYTFMTSLQVKENGATTIYSGSISNTNILTDTELTMTIGVTKSSSLVMKELYYNASKTSAGKPYMKEQFYEIYNNGEETVYVDGLCFGNLMPENATGKANYDWGSQYPLTDYVFFGRIMQVPGTPGVDKNYPLNPGESIILCQYATDHTVPELNPDSIDLSSGEFEWYEPTNTNQTDQPAINLKMAFPINPSSPYKIWNNTSNGPALAMFFPVEEFSIDKMATDKNNGVSISYPIPVSIILDAVEAIKDETQVQNKRVPTSLDAGYIWVTDDNGEPAIQVGKSIVRKVIGNTEDGRVILQDTNNTTEDFELKSREIRRYGAKVPSWNTWAN